MAAPENRPQTTALRKIEPARFGPNAEIIGLKTRSRPRLGIGLQSGWTNRPSSGLTPESTTALARCNGQSTIGTTGANQIGNATATHPKATATKTARFWSDLGASCTA